MDHRRIIYQTTAETHWDFNAAELTWTTHQTGGEDFCFLFYWMVISCCLTEVWGIALFLITGQYLWFRISPEHESNYLHTYKVINPQGPWARFFDPQITHRQLEICPRTQDAQTDVRERSKQWMHRQWQKIAYLPYLDTLSWREIWEDAYHVVEHNASKPFPLVRLTFALIYDLPNVYSNSSISIS